MFTNKKLWLVCGLLLLIALGFRLFIALRLPNDTPDDGRVYAQIARNVLEQHLYSHDSEPPYTPSLIRLPGYPLSLAAIYSVAGHGNNKAVRIVQALVDTATCGLIALVAFEWVPDEKWKHTAAIAALALAAICPFTAIYASTILTEVPTNFLAVALALLTTMAFGSDTRRKTLMLWFAAGITGGLAVLFRPDSGLFAAAVGITIVISAFFKGGQGPFRESTDLMRRFGGSIPQGAVFSLAFCLVLVPWTIRNQRVFHLFQPLAPAHGEMPGEFVPRGYLTWLRTWLDDERYIGPVLWTLDAAPIKIGQFPDRAFDSSAERDRVAVLLEKYNHPPEEPDSTTQAEPPPQINSQTVLKSDAAPQSSPGAVPSPSDEEDKGDEGDEGDEEKPSEDAQQTNDGGFSGEMNPEIDTAFAQLARERIARAPLRYYLLLPLKRAGTLWFDTHSQYYPFDGELLPLEDLDHTIHQQFWLPLFATLTWIYSVLGVIGAWSLWRSRNPAARRWVILAALIIFLRLGFFSTLENPEPRYTVEIFPFLSILCGIFVASLTVKLGGLWSKRRTVEVS
jgi:Dolichyl-phosphate-mannose-protein mannosyltransferase